MSEHFKSESDIPFEESIPEPGASLESILCTEELQRRPSRQPDYENENRALVKLVSALAESPATILQILAETILDITQCDSAGLSLLTSDGKTPDVCGKRFYWPAIAGMWNPHVGGGTPRDFGPCGDVLDQNRTLLFRHFERRYPYLLPVIPAAEECLLVPLYVAGEAVGTIWAIMHSDRRKFDAEDDRVMASLGKFASSAYQALIHIEELKIQVSEREKAEAEIRELAKGLEAKIRRLVEANIIGLFIWGVDGRITDANEAFLRTVGYSRDDLVSGRLRWRELTPPEWRDADDRRVAQLKATGIAQPYEKEYFQKSGSRVPVLIGAASFEGRLDEGVGFVLDLTERKRAEEVLKENFAQLSKRNRYQTIISTVTRSVHQSINLQDVLENAVETMGRNIDRVDYIGIYLVEGEEAVLRAYRGYPDWFVKRAERIPYPRGISWKTIMEGKSIYCADVDQDTIIGPAGREVGTKSYVSMPIFFEGKAVGALNITSLQKNVFNEDEIKLLEIVSQQVGTAINNAQKAEALREAQAELAHVARVVTLGEMIASIAHEINQPLAAVVNNASACLRWLKVQNLEEARKSAEVIIPDGHRASEIIGRIRALAKKAPIHKDWLDINDAIREVITLVRSEAQRNGLAIETHLSDDVPLVLGDRVQLQQVILNLMMNSIEAMSEVGDGPRELRVSSERVESGDVLIAVRDSGPGLDPEHLDRLFEPFYTTKPQGLGMGLAISRSIVEAHGGRLWATANVPHGTVFQFTLPIGSEGMS